MDIYIDFNRIETMGAFYEELTQKLALPSYFGKNLDALYDSISGNVALPLTINFINFEAHKYERFQPLIETMEALSKQVDGFSFFYYDHNWYG